MKVLCFTLGDLHDVKGITDPKAIEDDRHAEVSRGHSRIVSSI